MATEKIFVMQWYMEKRDFIYEQAVIYSDYLRDEYTSNKIYICSMLTFKFTRLFNNYKDTNIFIQFQL